MKGAIFDMDGTLLDSMQVWAHVGEQYLQNRGIEPEDGLGDVLFPMSMRDGAVYVKEKYGLPDSPDTIVADMNAIVFAAYRDEVIPKPGVVAYLEALKKRGIPMAVATATDRPMVEAALARTGLAGYFYLHGDRRGKRTAGYLSGGSGGAWREPCGHLGVRGRALCD